MDCLLMQINDYVGSTSLVLFALCQRLSLPPLQIGLLLILSSLGEVQVAVVEKQVSNFGQKQLQAIGESRSQSIIADDSSLERGQGDSSEVSSHQVVLSAHHNLSLYFALLVKLSFAGSHDFSNDGLILSEASNFNIFFQQFNQSLFDELFQQSLIGGDICLLAFQLVLGVFFNFLDHIESNLHFGHAAFIGLSAFEDLLCDFDVIFHAFEDILIFIVGLIFNLTQLEFLLSVGLVVDDSELVIFESLDGEFEFLHAGFKYLVGVWHVMMHLSQFDKSIQELISTLRINAGAISGEEDITNRRDWLQWSAACSGRLATAWHPWCSCKRSGRPRWSLSLLRNRYWTRRSSSACWYWCQHSFR